MSMLSRLMETKTSLVLQVPTKHKHEKNNMNINHIY